MRIIKYILVLIFLASPALAAQDVLMQVVTNESSTCKYGTSDVAYDSMPNTFSSTGGLTHQQTLSSLACDAAYSYYVRCMDAAGNKMTSSENITFSIDAAVPTGNAPRINYADINATGTQLRMSFTEDPARGSAGYDCEGFTLTNVDNGVTVSSLNCIGDASSDCTIDGDKCSGDGYDRMICNLSGVIYGDDDDILVNYTASGADRVVACDDDTPVETFNGYPLTANNGPTIDSDPPSVTITTDFSSALPCNSEQQITATVTDASTTTCYFNEDIYSDSGAMTADGTTYTGTITLTGCGEEVTYEVICIDSASNEGLDSTTVTVSARLPTLIQRIEIYGGTVYN